AHRAAHGLRPDLRCRHRQHPRHVAPPGRGAGWHRRQPLCRFGQLEPGYRQGRAGRLSVLGGSLMNHCTLMIRRTLISALLVVTAGCVATSPQPDPEEMYQKAAALTKVTAMVESLVTYSDVALNAD